MGYRQGTLWLSQDELAELIGQIRSALASKRDNKPAPGRHPHLLSIILFPTGQRPQHRTSKQADHRQ